MARSHPAFVTAALLVWARTQARLKPADAAKKAGTSEEILSSWESAQAKPTIRQARLLAAAYRVPFAAFFLDQEPKTKTHIPKDLRRFAGTLIDGLSSSISLDVRDAWEKREIALELLRLQGSNPPTFTFTADIRTDPETTGERLRANLKVTPQEQHGWRDPRKAFNAWRARTEAAGVLVLQTSRIPLEEVRAYSLYAVPLPVVVVNRKDVLAGRSFSLLHELAHLGLRSEGICDLSTQGSRPPEDQRLEVHCNAVAAAALIPRSALLGHALVRAHGPEAAWTNDDIQTLARHFSSSREALLRRLLTLGLTTDDFYRNKRDEYAREYAARTPTPGFVTPPADAVSLLGKPFVRLVLDSLDGGIVTTSDAADYLGLRLKHLPALAASLEGE
jgi:Zn-dependent peptidase ImmA (M78 family)/DNA-binding XRE family transcriptional regulator